MLLFIDFRPGNWIVAAKRFSWASRSRVGVPLPSRVSLARPVLYCPLLYFTLTLAWPFCNRHDIFSHERTCLQKVFPSYMYFLSCNIHYSIYLWSYFASNTIEASIFAPSCHHSRARNLIKSATFNNKKKVTELERDKRKESYRDVQ